MKKIFFLLIITCLSLHAWSNNLDKSAKGKFIKEVIENRTIDNYLLNDICVNKILLNDQWILDGQWKVDQTNSKMSLKNYRNLETAKIISPAIDLPQIVTANFEKLCISFEEWYHLESDYDIGTVEISTDNGNCWTGIDFRSGTNGEDWTKRTIYLDNYAGQKIRLAFSVHSDESISGHGWGVRNITISKQTFDKSLFSKAKQPNLKSVNVGISGVLNSLSSQNFPYIYMNIALEENGNGITYLTKSNFSITENNIPVTQYNVTAPDGVSSSKLVDIVFIVDNSGSFDNYQNATRNNMIQFVDQLAASGNDFALGLCRFGQYTSSGSPILEDNGQLSSDKNYFKNTVWLRNVTDGSKEPAYHAIVRSAQGFNFRPGAQKIFIILADENPNQGGATKQEATDACVNNYISLFSMTTSVSAALNDIATASNGRSYNITDPFNDILNDISASITANYLISYKSPVPQLDGNLRNVNVTVNDNVKTMTSINITGNYIPGSAPIITRTPETINLDTKGWNIGQSFLISATITDAIAPFVQTATLYCKKSSETDFTAIAMTQQGTDNWVATIPGSFSVFPGIDYYIAASDGVITSSLPSVQPYSNPFQIAILPNSKPVITHTVPITTYSPGNSIQFQATVSDNTNWVDNVNLFYRREGDLLYTKVAMNLISGTKNNGNYSCSFQTPLDATAIEYYIMAIDDNYLSSLWASPDNPQRISSQQASNLTPHTWTDYGWPSPLVLSTQSTTVQEASIIYDVDTIFVSFSYKNNGNLDVSYHTIPMIVDNDTISFFIDELGAGYIAYLELYPIGSLNPGVHTISFLIDYDNQVPESDETDNIYSRTFTVHSTVVQLPNLAPFAPSGWDAPLTASKNMDDHTSNLTFYDNEDIYLNLSYANYGNGDAGSHNLSIFQDATLLYSENTTLDAGYYYHPENINIGKLLPGTYTIWYILDKNQQITETDETDNEYSIQLTVLASKKPNIKPIKSSGWAAELVVSNTMDNYQNSSTYYDDEELYFHFTIANNGDANAGAFYTRVYVNGLTYSYSLNELGIGIDKKFVNKSIGKLPIGDYEIRLFPDCYNDLDEWNENDNQITYTFSVIERPLPNLTPSAYTGWSSPIVIKDGLGAEQTTFKSTDNVFVSISYMNNGGSVSGAFKTALYLNDVQLQVFDNPSGLAVAQYGKVENIDLGTLNSGSYELKMILDPLNSVIESDETLSNNEYILSFEVVQSSPSDWTVVNYSNSTTAYAQVKINEQTASVNDQVAAFVNGECRAISTVVLDGGQSYATLIIQGEIAEDVEFRVWDVSEDKIYSNVYLCTTAPGGVIGAYPNMLPIYASDTYLQQFTFEPTWSLISMYVKPTDMSPSNLFAPKLGNSLVQIKTLNQSFDPKAPNFLNTLVQMNNTQGYFIKLNTQTNCDLQGQLLQGNKLNITLESGVNLVGYPFSQAQPIENGFSSLITSGKLVQVKSMTKSYDPSVPAFLNTLATLEPGKGYFVITNSSISSFTYPTPANNGVKSTLIEPNLGWEPCLYTSNSTYYYKVMFDDKSINEEAYVGAFVGDECRAIGKVINHEKESYVTLVINGTTQADLAYKLLYQNTEYNSIDSDLFLPNIVSNSIGAISFKKYNSSSIQNEEDKVYPNPVINDLNITLSDRHKGTKVHIVLFDLNGRVVHEETIFPATNNSMEISNIKENWKIDNGIYFMRIESQMSSSMNKITIR